MIAPKLAFGAILFTVHLLSLIHAGSIGGKPSELYDSNDKLVILNNATFNSHVYNKTNVWLVEFYNSWCGFCQRFAPTWKEFAASVHAWREVTTVGVVDCANFDNNPLCRNLEIMSYPTLRVFSPLSKVGSLGTDLKAEKTVTGIRHALLDYLEKEQLDGKGSPIWPNITPYRSSEQNNVWKNVPYHIEFTFLIFEDTTSQLGKEVILDYHKVRNAQIRRVTTNNEAFAKLMEIANFPSLAVMKRDMSVVHLIPKAKTRDGYSSAIHSFLAQNGGIVDADAVREIPREKDLFGVSQKFVAGEKEDIPDVVYRVDLENTLRYSLKHEIGMHRIITGESLVALQNYLRTLASFFPTKPKGTMFLERLRDWVLSMDDVIKGEEFVEKVNELETEIDFKIPVNQDWIGCKGSHNKYRGYTCGLWTMFHALTVSAASQNKKRLTPGSDNVLKTILLYVKHFFGCEGCSKHFQQMAKDRHLESVKGISESVLWLWEAHNVVNKRLKGDITEDPFYPKIQFPPTNSCFNCRELEDDWDRDQVLYYLKERFSKNNICQQDKVSINLCKPFVITEPATSGSSPTLNALHLPDVVKLSGWDFNVADVSLCVFLYVCSAIILILVYFKFVVRRGYRKKYNLN